MPNTPPTFGDNVRIRTTPLTEKLGLAALTGSVYGETKPSISGVNVIGESTSDHAINVMLESRQQAYWFAPDLVELIDHAPGTQITLGSRKLIRDAAGEWAEFPGKSPPLKRSLIARLFGPFREKD
jgi:hypothetical protein